MALGKKLWSVSKVIFLLRKCFVVFNSVLSELLSVNFGVPQGTMEGPILVIIFMNDVVNSAQNVDNVLFADDTNIFLTDSDPVRIIHRTKHNPF